MFPSPPSSAVHSDTALVQYYSLAANNSIADYYTSERFYIIVCVFCLELTVVDLEKKSKNGKHLLKFKTMLIL